jgi:hypothetical protein
MFSNSSLLNCSGAGSSFNANKVFTVSLIPNVILTPIFIK